MSKRANHDGSIRKKVVTRNGKEYQFWEARITTGYDPGTGKQIVRSFSGKTQKEVREKMQAVAVELKNNTYFQPSRITVSEWAEIWLRDYLDDVKYLTQKHYRAQCNTHIIPSLGATKLCELTPVQINAFYHQLTKDGLSPKSVRNIHGVMMNLLGTAVRMKYLQANPASGVTLPRVTKKEISPLSDEQLKAFLIASEKDDFAILFKLIPFTGLREGEALGLTWDCVDSQHGTLKIDKQLQRHPNQGDGFTLVPTKSDKVRIIKPAPFVMELLTQRKREQITQRLAAGELWTEWRDCDKPKQALVFTTPLGTPLQARTVVKHYKKIVESLGIPDSRVYDLRHTYAVLSLQNGDDPKTVQNNLGHATAAFTLDVYGHVSDRMKDTSAARMQDYITDLMQA